MNDFNNPQPSRAPRTPGSARTSSKFPAKAAAPSRVLPASKAAARFPDVGVTLRSYSREVSDAAARPPRGGSVVIKQSLRRRIFGRITLKRVVLTLLVLIIGIGGWLGFKFIYNAHKVFGGNILNILSTTKLKGEDSGQVNILLAGNSSDDVGHDGAQLTDSIMIISINTKTNKAVLLSVPRDLWVDIPGVGHQKINDAYVVGQTDHFSESGYDNGGMGLLEEVIHDNLGVTIDYDALVNYNAMRDAVNAVGGITVNIQSTDPRGLYDPSRDYVTNGPLVKLANGQQNLNGEQALDLARARGDAYGAYGFPSSDFDRTLHQRQMIVALKTKAVTAGVLSNPAKLASLADAIGNNVTTDLNLSEVHRLYDITKPITNSNIISLSLNSINGTNYLANYTSPNGESALIPADGLDDYGSIQTVIKQQLSSDAVVQEGAKVVILNGSNTTGLASQAETMLKAKNLDVTAVGNASAVQPTTTIIDASKGTKPASLKALEAVYGNKLTTTNPYSGIYDADFIVILGSDQVKTTTTSTTSAQ